MECATTSKKRKNQESGIYLFGRKAVLHAVYFLLGLLISKGAVLGSLAPFGASLAAAVPFSYIPAASVGTVLGYIMLGSADTFRYVAVIAAIGAIRWLLNDIKKISASRLYAPLVAFVPMLATGISLLFVSTSKMTEFSMCLTEAVIASAGAYFLSRTAHLMASFRALGTFSKQELACLAFSGCILVLSFGGLNFWGISVGRILAVLVILLSARYAGLTGGSISGIAMGVMFSISSLKMSFLGIGYAFGGMMGGLFATTGKIATPIAFAICNTVLSFGAGDNSLVLRLFAETCFAVAVYMVIPKDFGNRLRSAFASSPDRTSTEAMRKNVIQRLSHASKALESVKDCVNSVAEKLRRKDGEEIEYIYTFAAENTCMVCGLKRYCWQNQRDVTTDDFSRLGKILKDDGYVTDKTIDSVFSKKCCKAVELASSVNEGYKEYLSQLAASRRITQVRSVMAGQFAGISELLSDMCDEFEQCDEYDLNAADLITERLRREGLMVSDCACRIENGKGMTVELEITLDKKKEINKRELRSAVSACCGRVFDAPGVSIAENKARLTFAQLARYDADIGSSQHIAAGSGLCGDSLSYFSTGMGNLVAVISDGMGTGGRAAVDSNMAVSILKKLIGAGLSYDSSLSVINSSLMVKSEEESLATLDVADINLFSGKVTFLKAGAPNTYVKRGGRILKRESPSLPAGILNEIKFAKDSLTLHDGDRILMVSDGALAGDDKWIEDMLKGWDKASAKDFASLVVNEAIKRRNDGHEDDITAVAIHVIDFEKAEERKVS